MLARPLVSGIIVQSVSLSAVSVISPEKRWTFYSFQCEPRTAPFNEIYNLNLKQCLNPPINVPSLSVSLENWNPSHANISARSD